MTQEQAAVKLEQLSRDMGFRERMFANDASARAEWADLVRTAAGHMPASTGTAQTQAQAKLDRLMADPAWRTRYVNGDVAARDEMRALNATLAGPEEEVP